MQTVLVLGATGLLGHQVMRVLSPRYRVVGTTQRAEVSHQSFRMINHADLRLRLSAHRIEDFHAIIREERPDVVINCIGIVKCKFSHVSSHDAELVNTAFPLNLAKICDLEESRLIHISSDCVYSGRTGNYSELDLPDPVDAYGRTKLQGEPLDTRCLTLRTSFIGMECDTANGLVSWLISKRGDRVRGYTKAIFSGLTTVALAQLLSELIECHGSLHGIWHVSADPIDKYRLLCLVNQALDLKITIDPDESVVCDRSLNSAAFRAATGFHPRSWSAMVAEMAADVESYIQMDSI